MGFQLWASAAELTSSKLPRLGKCMIAQSAAEVTLQWTGMRNADFVAMK